LKPYRIACLILLLLTVTACRERGRTPDEVPTIAAREALETAVVMTQNAPPPGFRDTVSFPLIDNNLAVLPSWTYELTVRFSGVVSGTDREISGETNLQTAYRQIGQRRRVVVRREGDLLEAEDRDVSVEGVRIAQNVFRVRDNVCTGEVTANTPALADLRAGDLIGGVVNATPASGQERVNGEEVWRYAFDANDLAVAPLIQGGTITGVSGELWVAPEHNAVIRYYVNIDVDNAIVFDSDAPVTGQVIIRYDLLNIGGDPNITRPFGC
jgi:hypothetical protein